MSLTCIRHKLKFSFIFFIRVPFLFPISHPAMLIHSGEFFFHLLKCSIKAFVKLLLFKLYRNQSMYSSMNAANNKKGRPLRSELLWADRDSVINTMCNNY